MIQFYCNVNEAMNNQTEEDKSQQQLQHHKHDQQQLPQMLTESTQTQDGAINKLDGNLDDIAGECSGESDQLSKREGNVSKNQEDKSQQQLQHHKHDQQQLPQMLTESTQTQDGAVNKLDGNLDDIAGECSGESDQLSKREGNVSKTQEDRSQQQLQHHKHDQQQLPQMLTESTQTQDGAINKLDVNLDDIAGECSGESDQLSKREGNVSKNQEDKSQQQLQHHKHDQQQLPQMLTESTQTQDGAINKLDGNLDDIAGECSGEPDQLSKREGNVSKNQFLAVGNIEQKPQTEQFHDHQARDDGQTQHQQQSDKQKQDDQQLPQLQSSKPQMENEPIPPKDQVITNEARSGGDERSGKGENRGPNPEQNRSGHASGYRGHRGRRGRGGKPGTVGHGKNEQPGRIKSGNVMQQKPSSYDATYSDEEDDKTVQHPDFEFFWKKWSPFSQWFQRKFIVGAQQFVTAEQFMMYQKAVIFQDYETAEKILKERNPGKQQKLGRQARNFDPQKWKEVCLEIVKTANHEKFSQNRDLKNHLFSTYPKTLVEASPYDRIWGIGRAASDPKAQTKETWLGHNLLGYALTDIRNKMMIKEGIIPMDAQTFLAESALIDIENFDEVERFV